MKGDSAVPVSARRVCRRPRSTTVRAGVSGARCEQAGLECQ